jgi:DnaK suppressor protein
MNALNKADRSHWRAALDQRAAELQGELSNAAADERDAGALSPRTTVQDDADVAEERIRDALRAAEARRDLDELRDIRTARERLACGSYGECVDCGVQIPRARLEAMPASARCVECQARHERAQAVEGRVAGT